MSGMQMTHVRGIDMLPMRMLMESASTTHTLEQPVDV